MTLRLPDGIRESFRKYGRAGGHARAARLTPERRRQVARHAATVRWIRQRYGSARFEDLALPGGDIVDTGLRDLVAGRATVESLAVSLAAPRLRREGIPVGETLQDPEARLYESLAATNPDLAHARYNAYLRRLVSFADACRFARIDRGDRHAA